jgi:hypothetical protein
MRVTAGLQTIVNLAEQHGREGVVTSAYREYVEEVNLSDVKYVSCELFTRVCTDVTEDIANMIFTRRPRV